MYKRIRYTFFLLVLLLIATPANFSCGNAELPDTQTTKLHLLESETITKDSAPDTLDEPEIVTEITEGPTEEEIMIAERVKLEKELKEKLGPFFVPLPPFEQKENPRIKAKGFYVTANSAGLESRFNSFIEMIEETELNSMVIDVKNDHGMMTYPSEIEIVAELMEGYLEPVRDIRKLIEILEQKDIYPIARIVVFRDPYLPEHYPEWAIQDKQGGIWRDNKGFAWVNPYEKKVWDYNIAIAKEAALMGFREIQFDYIRFPENAEMVDEQAYYPGSEGINKDEVIREFITYASQQLEEYNVYLAADVFGVIATYFVDKDKIGQTWEYISPNVDYICPMVYPSHYTSGFFGYNVPDANPEGTIKRALEDALKRNGALENPASIRPWLQGFTATWIRGNISYGPKQIRQQIDAALSLGIEEFFIWNARNVYDATSFISAEEAFIREGEAMLDRISRGQDFLGRTSKEALDDYINAMVKRNYRDAYQFHSTNFSMSYLEYQQWAESWTYDNIEFETVSETKAGGKTIYELNINMESDQEEINMQGQQFEVFMENNIWKVKPSLLYIEMLSRLK